MTAITRALLCLILSAMIAACAGAPVRHLASDASLIKAGASTKEEVLTYLGDPDSRQTLSDRQERWIYYEERKSDLQQTPYLGRLFNAKGYDQIIITFEGDTVIDCRFNSFDADEFDWADDYSWQEKRE
ncbi:hypothetical protein [Desulfofustis limnaeus]|uniref:Lipoprotein SmpA/OmlA domain-containing protein n=1 Tax=Desulfofustis limnaeus TaxID=2740163 RepID=A0ABM7W402_9BACT|nr:hypothetical protein [Desulfofustis limnaeus]MDX9895003.1 hypothetical protein [Desulfofustis sp.]BDD85640.1 hypothetical protein DPPLL_00050 [Desulfofustis limnaeus]